jgi:hypothetical protein
MNKTLAGEKMAITIGTSVIHWNYFLALESDLHSLSRYIEFAEPNLSCYSVEISRLLFSASSEVDVVAKQLCLHISPHSKAGSINAYRNEITTAYPEIPGFDVTIPRFGMAPFKPWENWAHPDGVPMWWTAYNKVKHHRNTEFHQANLKNAINAVGALFILVLHLYKQKAEDGDLTPIPSLFRVTEEHFDGATLNDADFGINYKL